MLLRYLFIENHARKTLHVYSKIYHDIDLQCFVQ